MERCGCGGLVPVEGGPRHPYMESAPACWRLYGELTIRLLALSPAAAQPSHVDCFATQHTGGADNDRRQRSSIAVHLVALCARIERGITAVQLQRLRPRVSATVLPTLGMDDWPLLTPPDDYGELTVAVLWNLPDDEFGPSLADWPGCVWSAWQHQHATVRVWTDALLEAL
ncbi:DUF5946 family protein [Micromonospora sp. CB01531]|uniref:DUF5946 family protein n=1 Tax=Micromonospora sp. CB01531 TaxID=1718947 RepID=UPI002379CA48|nr:DUF5946 family protein [Micromonospora sp. CB01531]